MSNNYMDEQEAIDLITKFARNQTQITHQANSSRGISKKAVAAEKKLSERILGGLIGRKLDDYLKAELTKRLND